MQVGDRVETNKVIVGPPSYPLATKGTIQTLPGDGTAIVKLDPQQNNVLGTFNLTDLNKIS